MFEHRFSRWENWSARLELAGLEYPGVYVIARVRRDISGRAFSWRPEIVYVGMTNAVSGLGGRLKQFDDTIQGRLAHGGADRVRFRFPSYARLAPLLYVAVVPHKCNVRAPGPSDFRVMGAVARLEYLCFAEHARKFGDVPQFNRPTSPKYSKQPKDR